MKKILFFGLILIGLIFISACGKQNPTTQAVKTNCQDVQVPYDEIESYTDTVPYTAQECENKLLVYKKEQGQCESSKSGFFGVGDEPAKHSCTITNLDTEAGTFSMNIGFNIGGQQLGTTQNKYIYPQSSETFSYQTDSKIDSCYCQEQAPTKQVCRDVIKYKDVQKTRTVTKYRTEQKCN